MLKIIHAQENKTAAKEKAKQMAQTLREIKLKEAATKIENSIEGGYRRGLERRVAKYIKA